MILNIILMVGPLLIAPVLVLTMQMLVASFLVTVAKLIIDMELPGSIARRVGTDISMRCVITYLLCWWAGWGCYMLQWPLELTLGFCIGGVVLALGGTVTMVHKKLAIRKWGDAFLVGLLTYGGGNLPLIVLVALSLYLVATFS